MPRRTERSDEMGLLGFRRSTLVDAAVNAVPLAIIVFFLAFYLVWDPWRPNLLSLFWEVVLHVVPIVTLVAATGLAAWLIQRDEESSDEKSKDAS